MNKRLPADASEREWLVRAEDETEERGETTTHTNVIGISL
jgi:hypothetical protein